MRYLPGIRSSVTMVVFCLLAALPAHAEGIPEVIGLESGSEPLWMSSEYVDANGGVRALPESLRRLVDVWETHPRLKGSICIEVTTIIEFPASAISARNVQSFLDAPKIVVGRVVSKKSGIFWLGIPGLMLEVSIVDESTRGVAPEGRAVDDRLRVGATTLVFFAEPRAVQVGGHVFCTPARNLPPEPGVDDSILLFPLHSPVGANGEVYVPSSDELAVMTPAGLVWGIGWRDDRTLSAYRTPESALEAHRMNSEGR